MSTISVETTARLIICWMASSRSAALRPLSAVVPRSWTHLLGIAGGRPVDRAEPTPAAWRELVRRRTGTEPPELMTDGASGDFTPFEAGFDHTRSGTGQYEGWLRKFTIAPQIGAGRKFFSRPVLRVFLTYASWSDGLRGFVGGIPYLTRTGGLTYGVQAETWF